MNEVFGGVYIVVEFPFAHLRPSVWVYLPSSIVNGVRGPGNATEEGFVAFAESEHDVAVVAAAGQGRLVASFEHEGGDAYAPRRQGRDVGAED